MKYFKNNYLHQKYIYNLLKKKGSGTEQENKDYQLHENFKSGKNFLILAHGTDKRQIKYKIPSNVRIIMLRSENSSMIVEGTQYNQMPWANYLKQLSENLNLDLKTLQNIGGIKGLDTSNLLLGVYSGNLNDNISFDLIVDTIQKNENICKYIDKKKNI